MAISSIGGGSSKLFSALGPQSGSLETMSQQALASGIDKYMAKDYEGAVQDFRRSIGISPTSSYSVNASDYMASAFLKQGKTEEAIRTYKESIQRHSNLDSIHSKLGNLYYGLGRYNEAESEYRAAVRLNRSAPNLFALGQIQLTKNDISGAKATFTEVNRLAPTAGDGYFGLGQAYEAEGRYDKAITEIKKSIEIKGDNFLEGYAELGYIYADTGQKEEAENILKYLKSKDSDLAATLSLYMYKVEKPRIVHPTVAGTFTYTRRPDTQVANIDSYLETANASKQFTMSFQFSKQMDFNSVVDRFNWRIERSDKTGPGEEYNFGNPVPSTEVEISPYPDKVRYDKDTMQATIYFTISQNATADATIDPSHIIFSFSGEDIFGNKMDVEGDEYSKFTGVV